MKKIKETVNYLCIFLLSNAIATSKKSPLVGAAASLAARSSFLALFWARSGREGKAFSTHCCSNGEWRGVGGRDSKSAGEIKAEMNEDGR